jgi:hypothetical protein
MTPKERFQLISAIADRALGMEPHFREKFALVMDLDYADQDCPLDLFALLQADEANFAHDVFGIYRHLDRKTKKLTDCFTPRYALQNHGA